MFSLSRSADNIFARWWWTIDRWNLLQILSLAIIGVIFVWASSTSAVENLKGIDDPHYFLFKHIKFLILGIFLMISISFLSNKGIYRIGIVGFLVFFIMLVCVLFFGINYKGATRWLDIGLITIQPSEFIKPFFVLVTALFLSKKSQLISEFSSKVNFGHISLLLLLSILFLLYKQPDFGMAILLLLLWFGQYFLIGLSFRWFFALVIFLTTVLLIGYHSHSHVKTRIDSFLNLGGNEEYQLNLALKAYESGSLIENLFGKGPGKGIIKKSIPDAHTDFIFPVIAEEFGAVICFIIIVLFGAIVLRGFWRILNSENLFQLLCAGGLLMLFGMQVLINISVTLSLIPTTGMTLPFISYGGSSLISSFICMGMVLALTKKNH